MCHYRYSLMENSARALLGNTKTWLRCSGLVRPSTHSVLIMPILCLLKGLICFLFLNLKFLLFIWCWVEDARQHKRHLTCRGKNEHGEMQAGDPEVHLPCTALAQCRRGCLMFNPATGSIKLSGEAEMLFVKNWAVLSRGWHCFSGRVRKEWRELYV